MKVLRDCSINECKVNGHASEDVIPKFSEKLQAVPQFRNANLQLDTITVHTAYQFMATVNRVTNNCESLLIYV